MSTVEPQSDQVSDTENYDAEVQLYFFHSTPEKQNTFRQYSAAGYVSRTRDTDEPFIAVAYSVCSELDTFSKKKACLITSGRLQKAIKVHRLPITEDQYQHPARTLRDTAILYVPGSTLPKEAQPAFLKLVNESDPTIAPLTNAHDGLIQIPTKAELEAHMDKRTKEAQAAADLSNVMTQINRSPMAEA